ARKPDVDRKLVLQAINNGQGELAVAHPVSSAYGVYSPLPPRATNIDRARQLMKDAGLANGVTVKLYAANSPPIRERIAVVLKEMAQPAGFNFDVEVLAYDRYLAQVWNKGAMYVVYYATRPTPDAILMKLYHPKEGPDEWRGASTP